MLLDDVKKLAQQGESHRLEFKKSTARLKAACETACAFLNTDGGTVLIGITDDRKLVGQEVSDKTKREIGNALSKIAPIANIKVAYTSLPNSNKYIIVFDIMTDSLQKPYVYDGRAFLRNQSDTIQMPREYYQQLTISNSSRSVWEDQTQPNVTLEDLDVEEILATVKEGSLNGRIPTDFDITDPWLALQHLGLIEDNKITNAAIILFGKTPERWFPQCVLKLARFRGAEKEDFIDNKRVTGHAFKLLKETMAFINTYLPIASAFPKNSIERIDTPLFPIPALREAIVNAICHRDYSDRSGSLSFAIFDDRLEIWNYGLLPNGITLEQLKHLNQSVPRNTKIANVFYYHKLTETWGRGVKMIIKLCTQANHPEPIYCKPEQPC